MNGWRTTQPVFGQPSFLPACQSSKTTPGQAQRSVDPPENMEVTQASFRSCQMVDASFQSMSSSTFGGATTDPDTSMITASFSTVATERQPEPSSSNQQDTAASTMPCGFSHWTQPITDYPLNPPTAPFPSHVGFAPSPSSSNPCEDWCVAGAQNQAPTVGNNNEQQQKDKYRSTGTSLHPASLPLQTRFGASDSQGGGGCCWAPPGLPYHSRGHVQGGSGFSAAAPVVSSSSASGSKEQQGESMRSLDCSMTEVSNPPSFAASELQVFREHPHVLGSFDLTSLSASQVLFCFGVLATQILILPRFQFIGDKNTGNGKFGVKLTVYGYTFRRNQAFDSEMEAKVEVCREALTMLKHQLPRLIVPNAPFDYLTTAAAGWNWVELLRDYCVQNGLPPPGYTKYVHETGYRHEVEILGTSYFGRMKSYPSEWDSRNASAHMALYTMLVYGTSGAYSSAGPFTLKRTYENQLAFVPRIPVSFENMPAASQNSLYAIPRTTPAKRPAEDDTPRSPPVSPKKPKEEVKNANLLPLRKKRLPRPRTPQETKDNRKWKVTEEDIQRQIEHLKTDCKRVEKICDMLGLDQPEFRIKRLGGRLIESVGEYRVAAYFRQDPFLIRAGAIGEIKKLKGNATTVREACAKEVVKYLINMVREDAILEEEAAEREKNRNSSFYWRRSSGENGSYHQHDLDVVMFDTRS